MPNIIITKNASEEILNMVVEAVNRLSHSPNPRNTTGTGMFIEKRKGWSNERQLSKFVGIVNFQTDYKVIQRGK